MTIDKEASYGPANVLDFVDVGVLVNVVNFADVGDVLDVVDVV